MKKSRSVRLALLGSATIALAACDDGLPPRDAKFFSDVKECSAVYNEAQCRTAEANAKQAFATEAPRFTRKEECEAEYGVGNCETRSTAEAGSGGGSFFMPMLMGYMMGNMLGGSMFNQPVYRGQNNSAIVQGTQGRRFNVGGFNGSGPNAATSFRPATQVAQVTRGGFGDTSRSYTTSAGG